MKAIILGSGAARPDPDRSSPSQVVVVDKEPVLFDCGPGTAMNMMKAGLNPVDLNRIFLTHLHIDHCVEFPSVVLGCYLMGRKDKILLYGTNGTSDHCKLMFEKAYPYAPELVRRIRKAELSVEPTDVASGIVCETEKFKVTCAPVEHGFPTVAFRIESGNASVVISGDTRPCKSLIELAKGASLLLQDCSFPDSMADNARNTGHAIPSEVGEIASQANVKKVVLTHMFPPCKGKEQEMVKSVSSKFGGEVIAGYDLLGVDV